MTPVELKERTLQSKLRYWSETTYLGVVPPRELLLQSADALDQAEARVRELTEKLEASGDCTHSRILVDRASGVETCEDCGKKNPDAGSAGR